MAGLGYKVFTAGEVLTAANVNGYLMEQSVMVFANAAARTAALTSPTEGMVTYLEDTNSLDLYTGSAWIAQSSPITNQGDLIVGNSSGSAARLAIGANGTVLSSNGTTASWQTPASGGMTLLASGTLSSQALDLISISSSYKHLQLILRNFQTVSSGQLSFRINNNSNAQYYSAVQSSNNTANTNYSGETSFRVESVAVLNQQQKNNLELTIYNYAAAARKVISCNLGADSDGNQGQIVFQSVHGMTMNTDAAMNRLTSVQTITGNYELWGIR